MSPPLLQTAPWPHVPLLLCCPPPAPGPQPYWLPVVLVSQDSHASSWRKGFAHAFLLGWNMFPSFFCWLQGTTSSLPHSVECKPQGGQVVPVVCHSHISVASQMPPTRGRPALLNSWRTPQSHSMESIQNHQARGAQGCTLPQI